METGYKELERLASICICVLNSKLNGGKPDVLCVSENCVRCCLLRMVRLQQDLRRLEEINEEALNPTTPSPGHAEGCVCHRCRIARTNACSCNGGRSGTGCLDCA